jgi:NitT/TauT family transport system permease protein
MRVRRYLFPLLPLFLIAALLEWIVRKGWIAAYLVPAPSQVFSAAMEDRENFISAFLQTAEASVLGLFISIAVGFFFAVVLSISSWVRMMLYPYAIFFQTVPIIAIAPLLVIWFGYGLPTVVASAFIVSVFPVIANSVTGLLGTDPLWLDLFQMMGAKRLQVLFRLRIPAALPQIFTGIEIASGLAVIGAIVGEFISGGGLGGLVDAARNQQRVDRVFAAVILASVLGVVFFAGVALATRMFSWRGAIKRKDL